MIPTPIQFALETLRQHRVPALVLGGQASILHGGAEFSRDLDLLLTAAPANLGGKVISVVAVADLVLTKKTQRDKDWAIIGALVRADMIRHRDEPTAERVRFWLEEAREPDDLIALAADFPDEVEAVVARRPLVGEATRGDRSRLALEVAKEQLAGKEADRLYWEPLRAELEELRHRQRRIGPHQ